jgi:hypothetical protein
MLQRLPTTKGFENQKYSLAVSAFHCTLLEIIFVFLKNTAATAAKLGDQQYVYSLWRHKEVVSLCLKQYHRKRVSLFVLSPEKSYSYLSCSTKVQKLFLFIYVPRLSILLRKK